MPSRAAVPVGGCMLNKDAMHKLLEVENARVSVEGKTVVDSVSLGLKRGTVGCLLGPSGSGKTVLLHCIAGFRRLDAGTIRLDGRTLSGPGVHVAPEERRVGMMFQSYALFPHLDVEKNVAFGIRKMNKAPRERNVAELLELVGLGGHAHKYPHELSGGEQQRVALARALAPAPRLLLLDEPFSSLDTELRLQLAEETKQVVTERNITTLLVTHDQEEAFATADVLGVIDDGRLLQWNSAYDVYHKPASRDVATFIGMGSMLRGKIQRDDRVTTALGLFPMDRGERAFAEGEEVDVLIRPDDVIHDDDSPMKAVICKKQFRGAEFLYQLQLDSGETVYCFAPSHHDHRIGEALGITVDVEHVVIYSRQRPGGSSAENPAVTG